MTDDIVARLRDISPGPSELLDALGNEGADEIERLRAALREVISVSDRKTDIYDRAKAALAGEKPNDDATLGDQTWGRER